MVNLLNISTIIEMYIKEIFQERQVDVIEIKRNELADKFSCAPSQVSYVMQTRFSLDKGYIVESKRGGGGFIRIQKLDLPSQEAIHELVTDFLGPKLSLEHSQGIIQRLYQEALITDRERHILLVAVENFYLLVGADLADDPEQLANELDQGRAKLLNDMLTAILGKEI